MRRIYYAVVLAATVMLAWGCTEDESTGIQNEIYDIVITEFDKDGYTVVSYEGNILNLVPDIQTGYPESELTYRWYLIDTKREDMIINATDEKLYERECIGEERTLAYEVNLTPGDYTVVCEVQASNGYLVSQTTKLKVTTNFSEGFYILKETAGGHTDMDVFKKDENKLIENVVAAVMGEPLSGKPLALSMSFGHGYVDAATNERLYTDLASVATETGRFVAFRITDLYPLFTRDNLLFGEMEDDEMPYRIVSGMWENYYVANKGVRGNYQATIVPGSGLYGAPSVGGASKFITCDPESLGMIYWSDDTHTLYVSDFNGSCYELGDPEVTGLTDDECVACGTNDYMSACHFILRNIKTGNRTLYIIQAAAVASVIPLGGTHLEQAGLFSTNGPSASLIYCVDGNRIYGYDFQTGNEMHIRPEALPESAYISYVSDQTFAGVEYFVIGTQDGDKYTLYFYNVLGGQPVYVVTGSGIVKSMHYTRAGYSTRHYTPQIMD